MQLKKIVEFESSKYERGIRTNCCNDDWCAFVNKLLKITEDSDYINMLHSLHEYYTMNYNQQEEVVIQGLMRRYKEIRDKIGSFAQW